MPVSGRALDIIKIAAAVLMVLDHIDYMWLDRTAPLLMLLGRGAFPLFAYATACAVLRGGEKSARRYGMKIGLFAMIIEPLVRLTRGGDILNVLFTLAAGAMAVPLIARLPMVLRAAVFIAGIYCLKYPNTWEYGVAGLLLPAAFYLYLTGRRDGGAWAIVLMAALNFSDFGTFTEGMTADQAGFMVLTAAASVFIPLAVIGAAGNIFQKDRIVPKYFLHIFYPAHLVALAMLRPFL